MEQEFKKGSIVDHDRYGNGVVCKVSLTGYEIIFERGGKMNFSKSNTDLTLIEDSEDEEESNEPKISLTEISRVLEMVLDTTAYRKSLKSGRSGQEELCYFSLPTKNSSPKKSRLKPFFIRLLCCVTAYGYLNKTSTAISA